MERSEKNELRIDDGTPDRSLSGGRGGRRKTVKEGRFSHYWRLLTKRDSLTMVKKQRESYKKKEPFTQSLLNLITKRIRISIQTLQSKLGMATIREKI